MSDDFPKGYASHFQEQTGGYLTEQDLRDTMKQVVDNEEAHLRRASEVAERWRIRYPRAFLETLTSDERLLLSAILTGMMNDMVLHPSDAAVINGKLNEYDRRKAEWEK